MPTVSMRPSGSAIVGDLVVLECDEAGSAVTIAPARGALTTSFRVAGRELLYLDESTLTDPAKNVRGGIPVLFPSPGKLEDDHWQCAGEHGAMKQHGFARNLAWQIAETDMGTPSVTLELGSSSGTLAQYPWAFLTRLKLALARDCLRIDIRVKNTGSARLPFGLGFHPYFRVVDKARAHIDTDATRAFDNVTKRVQPLRGIDLTASEIDLHLLDHSRPESALHLGDGARIEVRASADFTRWVVWTLAGRDFVCLEPWTAPGNALNTGDGLLWVEPDAMHESWLEIAARCG